MGGGVAFGAGGAGVVGGAVAFGDGVAFASGDAGVAGGSVAFGDGVAFGAGGAGVVGGAVAFGGNGEVGGGIACAGKRLADSTGAGAGHLGSSCCNAFGTGGATCGSIFSIFIVGIGAADGFATGALLDSGVELGVLTTILGEGVGGGAAALGTAGVLRKSAAANAIARDGGGGFTATTPCDSQLEKDNCFFNPHCVDGFDLQAVGQPSDRAFLTTSSFTPTSRFVDGRGGGGGGDGVTATFKEDWVDPLLYGVTVLRSINIHRYSLISLDL